MYFFQKFPSDDFVDLTMYQFGRRECHPGYRSNFVAHSHYVFHYVFSGRGLLYIECDGAIHKFPVEQGQGFLLFPEYHSTYEADIDDPWHYAWVEFDGLKARESVKKTGLKVNQPVYTSADVSETNRMIDALNNMVNNPTSPQLELMANFYFFMNGLIQSSSTRKQEAGDSVRDFYVQEAIKFIQRNYWKDISIQDIADHCNIHRSYLSRIFKASIDVTPQEFLIRCRLDVACELLKTTGNSVGEISQMVGYPNQLNFSRAFKRKMGQSPQKWRN